MLKFGLHRSMREYVPAQWVDRAVDLRNKWNERRYRSAGPKVAAEQQ
jgi:hypothetical protein